MILCGVCCTPLAFAQQDEHHDDRRDNQQYARHDDNRGEYVRHNEWKKGYHMRDEDWNRGQRVDDWRAHHLSAPREGYEWREIDGNYVMADSHGVVTTVVVAPRR